MRPQVQLSLAVIVGMAVGLLPANVGVVSAHFTDSSQIDPYEWDTDEPVVIDREVLATRLRVIFAVQTPDVDQVQNWRNRALAILLPPLAQTQNPSIQQELIGIAESLQSPDTPTLDESRSLLQRARTLLVQAGFAPAGELPSITELIKDATFLTQETLPRALALTDEEYALELPDDVQTRLSLATSLLLSLQQCTDSACQNLREVSGHLSAITGMLWSAATVQLNADQVQRFIGRMRTVATPP